MSTVGRNDPCPCGSGKKYKKCCEEKLEAKQRAEREKEYQAALKAMPKPNEEEKTSTTEGPATSHPPKQPERLKNAPQKHSTFVAPKFNMPRKAGGGG